MLIVIKQFLQVYEQNMETTSIFEFTKLVLPNSTQHCGFWG